MNVRMMQSWGHLAFHTVMCFMAADQKLHSVPVLLVGRTSLKVRGCVRNAPSGNVWINLTVMGSQHFKW